MVATRQYVAFADFSLQIPVAYHTYQRSCYSGVTIILPFSEDK